MDFAIIKTGGKQYKVKIGDVLKVEKLPETKGKQVEFSDILGGKTVVAERILEGRGPKVRILKFHPKKHYKRVTGARQNFSQIKILKIA